MTIEKLTKQELIFLKQICSYPEKVNEVGEVLKHIEDVLSPQINLLDEIDNNEKLNLLSELQDFEKQLKALKNIENELKKIKKQGGFYTDKHGAVIIVKDMDLKEDLILKLKKEVSKSVKYGPIDLYSKAHTEIKIKQKKSKKELKPIKKEYDLYEKVHDKKCVFWEDFTAREFDIYEIVNRVINVKLGAAAYEASTDDKNFKNTFKISSRELASIAYLQGNENKITRKKIITDIAKFGNKLWALPETYTDKKGIERTRVGILVPYAGHYQTDTLELTFTPTFLKLLGRRGYTRMEPLYLACQKHGIKRTTAMTFLLESIAYWHSNKKGTTKKIIAAKALYNNMNLLDDDDKQKEKAKRDCLAAMESLETMGYIDKYEILIDANNKKNIRYSIKWNPKKFMGAESAKKLIKKEKPSKWSDELEYIHKKISGKEIARRLKIDPKALRKWRKAETTPTEENQKKIKTLYDDLQLQPI